MATLSTTQKTRFEDYRVLLLLSSPICAHRRRTGKVYEKVVSRASLATADGSSIDN